jgi:hypothetical protein
VSNHTTGESGRERDSGKLTNNLHNLLHRILLLLVEGKRVVVIDHSIVVVEVVVVVDNLLVGSKRRRGIRIVCDGGETPRVRTETEIRRMYGKTRRKEGD